ncbi:hypothetical protein [Methyloligella solikamskensis]|uniref:Uncharacterized protein n=1 Tax=Methyloligella solikamskensis TaxID=1177756 RepID=A0ABW3JE59_9HYPH
MRGLLKSIFVLCGLAAFGLASATPASAGCELIKATNSAESPQAAARASQASAAEVAKQVQRKRGWGYVSMRARKVEPDPFWKAVRPVVPKEILIKPDIVTRKTYTQCWPGVVVPYVCTSGAVACGN